MLSLLLNKNPWLSLRVVTDCCGVWLCGRRELSEVKRQEGKTGREADQCTDGWTD